MTPAAQSLLIVRARFRARERDAPRFALLSKILFIAPRPPS